MNRRPGNILPRAGEVGWTALRGFLVAAALVIGVGVAASVRAPAPQVGDLFLFHPNTHLDKDWQVEVRRTADGTTCLLRPAVMAGSLVVEQGLPDGWTYRAHWQGQRTDEGPGDCGTVAELTLLRPDLDAISGIVGGPGLTRHGLLGS